MMLPGENVTRVLEILQKYGARLDVLDRHGRSPAHYCSSTFGGKGHQANAQALEFLYEVVPASIFVTDHDGQTPEALAVKKDTIAQVFFSKVAIETAANTCDLLERDVGELFDCRLDDVYMPAGVVAQRAPSEGRLRAFRCPNVQACPLRRNLRESASAGDFHTFCVGCCCRSVFPN